MKTANPQNKAGFERYRERLTKCDKMNCSSAECVQSGIPNWYKKLTGIVKKFFWRIILALLIIDGPIATFPQAYAMISHRSSLDVAPLTWAIMGITASLWTIRIQKTDIPCAVGCGLWAFCDFLIAVIALYFQKK